MNALAQAFLDQLDDAALDELARRLAPRLTINSSTDSGWLTPAEAADHLRCKRKRVYELIATGALPATHDGPRRRLIRRTDIDTYLEGKGQR